VALIERPARGILSSERTGPPLSNKALIAASVGLLGVGLAGLMLRRKAAPLPRHAPDAWRLCARDLNRAAAMLAASVVVDSAMEHFRGNYENRAMYIAPAAAALTMAAALSGRAPKGVATAVFGSALAIGATGLGFHAYNITKRVGGLSWQNLFYAAPFAAPGALALAGVLGLTAGRVQRARYASPRIQREVALGLAWTVSASLAVTVSEVWVLHFRGAFHDPFMYLPVTVVPAAAGALVLAGMQPKARTLRWARRLLNFTSLLGFAGTGFHAYGVSRNMGGFRNWSQMLFQGPPLPAPPSFTGLAIAGLGALNLLRSDGARHG
jgi:hypothetical protein